MIHFKIKTNKAELLQLQLQELYAILKKADYETITMTHKVDTCSVV